MIRVLHHINVQCPNDFQAMSFEHHNHKLGFGRKSDYPFNIFSPPVAALSVTFPNITFYFIIESVYGNLPH